MNTFFILVILLSLITAIIIYILLKTGSMENTSKKCFYALGTTINLTVSGKNREIAIEKAVSRLMDIEEKMSLFKDSSEISKINKYAGISPQRVSSDTYFVIKSAYEFCSLSKGTFDITIGPLTKLWGINTNHASIPSKGEINNTLKLVNYKDIILLDKYMEVMLKNKGEIIDVGGIAKGYAADEIVKIFKECGIKSAIIDLGGNIFVLGKKENKTLFNVGIQNPFKAQGLYTGILKLSDKSIVTSGNYERYFEHNGKRFHHIIDPKTGYPSESKIVSATIISDTSLIGDGLSTGVYILGVEDALKLIESMEGVDAVLITDDKKIYRTSNIKSNFTLEDQNFALA